MREPVIRLSIVVLTADILILAPGRNVPAETGWWERGKVLFEDFTGSDTGSLTNTEIASGLREALCVGTGNVVSQLGQRNGYFNDPKAHIPLPDSLDRPAIRWQESA